MKRLIFAILLAVNCQAQHDIWIWATEKDTAPAGQPTWVGTRYSDLYSGMYNDTFKVYAYQPGDTALVWSRCKGDFAFDPFTYFCAACQPADSLKLIQYSVPWYWSGWYYFKGFQNADSVFAMPVNSIHENNRPRIPQSVTWYDLLGNEAIPTQGIMIRRTWYKSGECRTQKIYINN